MRIYYLLLLLCFLVKASVFSQGIIDNDSHKIIFKAPNENFKDIELQAFHGLTRFGVLDTSEHLMNDVYISYKNFIKWSKEFMPNEDEEAYYVTISNVMYDLENQGLLISLDYSNVKNIYNWSVERIIHNRELNYDKIKPYKNAFSGAFITPESTVTSVTGDLIYKPRANYERILSSEAFVVFYEMSAEVANPILQDESLVYVVRKIKFYKDFTFHLVSPIIELYKNKSLTQKIGELDYNDLIFY